MSLPNDPLDVVLEILFNVRKLTTEGLRTIVPQHNSPMLLKINYIIFLSTEQTYLYSSFFIDHLVTRGSKRKRSEWPFVIGCWT